MAEGVTGPTSVAYDYVLGVDEQERTRLLGQAALHAPEAWCCWIGSTWRPATG